MATIKSYSSLEQSKKLAEILPLESADYCWGIDDETLHYNSSPYPCAWKDYSCKEYYVPCWSLAALLNILAKIASEIDDDGSAGLSSFMGQWSVNMFDCPVEATDNYDNPIDACVAMIEKLNKLNLL